MDIAVDSAVDAPLPLPPEKLLQQLDQQQIMYKLYHHEKVFTVADSQAIDRDIPGVHCRNMFIRDKKENMYLVTLRHETMIDMKKLADLLGCGRLSFGSPERLWSYMGIRPGSVNPFCILNDTESKVTQILEKGMMEADIMNVHPMCNGMTIGIQPPDLLKFLAANDVNPRIMDLSGAAP